MARPFPPPNQRKLNTIIAETFGSRYADWYDLAMDIYQSGGTYQTIADRFAAIGVPVSMYTVHGWLKERWAAEGVTAGKAASAA